MSQYDSSWPTDGCTSGACRTAFASPSSLDQGQQFAQLTKAFHGGSRRRQNRSQRKRMIRRRSRKQRGGAAPFPSSFSDNLPSALRGPADVAALDTAFGQLPQFNGKYGGVGGSRRRRRQHGGGLQTHAATIAESGSLLLPPDMETKAGLEMNSQFQTENSVNLNFKGPANGPLASQVAAAEANQIRYMAKGGRRSAKKSRKSKKSRKGRKSRKSRKGSRRH